MVFIHLKSAVVGGDNNTNASANNNDGFLYETTTSTKVDDLINSLVEVHNARLCSCLVADAVKGLAMYGVMKRPSSCVGDDDEVRIIPSCCAAALIRYHLLRNNQPTFNTHI